MSQVYCSARPIWIDASPTLSCQFPNWWAVCGRSTLTDGLISVVPRWGGRRSAHQLGRWQDRRL